MVCLATLAAICGLTVTAVSALPSTPLTKRDTSVSFFPTLNLTDTGGNAIQAHGGDIIAGTDGYYYWFGEDKTGETTSGHFIGVNCYKSSDFASWTYQGAVLTPKANTAISSTSVVERPKVIYNEANKEYVMWFHSDTSNYGAAQVGVATSKTVDGTYTWLGSWKPFGNDSRDMTIWKDDDGTAYLIFATDNNLNLEIASLTANYHNVSASKFVWESVHWEAPGMFKIDGTYYLLYSRQDGWTPTDNYYMTATSISGPWSDPVLLAPTGYYAYNTQNAYDITIPGSAANLYIYLGDHWNSPNLGASAYAFYPVVVNSTGGLSLHQTGGWKADLTTGTWADLSYTHRLISDSTTTVSPSSAIIACSTCDGAKTANLTSGTTVAFTWSGSAGNKVVSIEYIYNGGKNAWKQLGLSVDGVTQSAVAVLESTRGTTLYFEAPVALTLKKGSVVKVWLISDTGTAVYVRGFKVYGV